MAEDLRHKTAGTIKWNTIDRVASQVLYAVTGIVLANILTKEDFGLVGAIVVFQAFAILFVDSGFGAALLQKKEPTEADYSTVFWFNLMVSVAVYAILWVCAPLIADIFQGDERLIPLSRVMFLTFILNGLAIVQTNRLMKQMNVKQIAIAGIIGLFFSGAVGIILAVKDFGAWALVWQSITLALVKGGWLWITGHWVPQFIFSRESLKGIWRVGIGVFSSSFLNTVFLHIYSFVIGSWLSLKALGVYTQADKWSKMGSASLSQVITASFLPVLAKAQDNPDTFHRYMGKINRFTAFIIFPSMICLAVIAEPLFHVLFSTKWDAAIPLFQILAVRGIFVVLVSLLNNYVLSLGYARSLVRIEVVKDAATVIAILLTMFSRDITTLVWGQLAASGATLVYVWIVTAHKTGYKALRMAADMAPYVLTALVAGGVAYITGNLCGTGKWGILTIELLAGTAVYYSILRVFGSKILAETSTYLLRRKTA